MVDFCTQDEGGNYSLEDLSDAFAQWFKRQLRADEKTHVFIESDNLHECAREILSANADQDQVATAARQLAQEISSDPNGVVSYKDFMEVFKYRL
jgi:hypothetical protein